MKRLLVLSHGSSSVEGGFSVNKNIFDDNMELDTLVALRRVYEFVIREGGVTKVRITKELLTNVRCARMRYEADLKKNEDGEREEIHRKRLAEEGEMCELEAKIRRIGDDITSLKKEADAKAVSAEQKSDLSLLAQSNALRKAAAKKQADLKDVQEKLKELKTRKQ